MKCVNCDGRGVVVEVCDQGHYGTTLNCAHCKGTGKEDSFTTLGDSMKAIESQEVARAAPAEEIIVARLDGRAFHSFTKGLKRPFDERLTNLMIETTLFLVDTCQANCGYTQSDEITLVFFSQGTNTKQHFFGGKYQKIASTLAATATAYFNRNLDAMIPEKAGAMPTFDGRAWSVKSAEDVAKVLLWREKDAIKNSITMAALAHFSDKQILKKNGNEKIKMLESIGHPYEEIESKFRKGTYVARVRDVVTLSPEIVEKIPERYRPDSNKVIRSSAKTITMPEIRLVKNTSESNLLKFIKLAEKNDVNFAEQQVPFSQDYAPA